MMLEEALYTYLTGYSALTALISTRVYPDLLPENVTLPAVCYQRVSTMPTQTRDGGSEIRMCRFQFDVFGADAKTTWQVTNTLEKALNGFKGISNPRVDATFIDNNGAQYENLTEYHRVTVDALIQFLETFGA